MRDAGQRRRDLRQLGRRRTDRHRLRRVPHPGRRAVHRHYERLRARRRGCRALYPRCDARQADEHRRRFECRPDQRAAGEGTPRRRSRRKPTSTARWTVPANSSKAMPSPRIIILIINLIGGFIIGMADARHVDSRKSLNTFSDPDHRRRSGQPNSGAAHLDGHRSDRDPRRFGRQPGARFDDPIVPVSQTALYRSRNGRAARLVHADRSDCHAAVRGRSRYSRVTGCRRI